MKKHDHAVPLAASTLVLVLGALACAQPTSYRISQESAPGAGDFNSNIIGCIEPIPTGAPLATYYSYASASYNGIQPVATIDRAYLFLLDASDGLALNLMLDRRNDFDGGQARMQVDVTGDPDGIIRAVSDDPGDGYSPGPGIPATTHTTSWVWYTCCTDGVAYNGFDGNWTAMVQFTQPPVGIIDFRAHSRNGNELLLDLTAGRRVRIDTCSLPPVIDTDCLPCGSNGDPYSAFIRASAGTPPYTFSHVGGQMPPGLSLDMNTGELSGTLSMGGTYPMTIEVTDSLGGVAQRHYTFDADCPAGCAINACGDCDGDGFVSVLDAFVGAQNAVGLATFPGQSTFDACNVVGAQNPNPGAEVTILDALEIARHIVGLTDISCCPAQQILRILSCGDSYCGEIQGGTPKDDVASFESTHYFDLSVPFGTTSFTIDVVGFRDVDLYIGKPGVLPGARSLADYAYVEKSGLSVESITIDGSSMPYDVTFYAGTVVALAVHAPDATEYTLQITCQ
jgi:hypothetical protein